GDLHHERVRIGFKKLAPSVFDFVLVQFTRRQAGDEKFPHARGSEQTHLMLRAIPFIEVANDGYAFCIRCPDGERDALPAFVRDQMRAELFVDAFVLAFAKEMQVEFAERGREFVRKWVTLRLCAFARSFGLCLRLIGSDRYAPGDARATAYLCFLGAHHLSPA